MSWIEVRMTQRTHTAVFAVFLIIFMLNCVLNQMQFKGAEKQLKEMEAWITEDKQLILDTRSELERLRNKKHPIDYSLLQHHHVYSDGRAVYDER